VAVSGGDTHFFQLYFSTHDQYDATLLFPRCTVDLVGTTGHAGCDSAAAWCSD